MPSKDRDPADRESRPSSVKRKRPFGTNAVDWLAVLLACGMALLIKLKVIASVPW